MEGHVSVCFGEFIAYQCGRGGPLCACGFKLDGTWIIIVEIYLYPKPTTIFISSIRKHVTVKVLLIATCAVRCVTNPSFPKLIITAPAVRSLDCEPCGKSIFFLNNGYDDAALST